MSLSVAVLLVAVFCIADSMQSPYQSCGAGLPAPNSVNIAGCSQLPCNFKRGTFASAEVDFTVQDSTKTLTPKVTVHIGSISTAYQLPEQNACKSLVNGECPLDKGERVTYKLQMPIEKIYPKIALTIQLSLVDGNGKSQACIKIPSKVVD
ncbi:NPC intracellular cholesterol transporter 2 isoform X2 [Lasioglossum baleicum]|uniref:NPC intracellular cholesterol transporter 2 isoform X2 n=1 Tax=Lasioglossum baleicum TaxID=434251 RepID=UPI003FCE1DC8